MMSEIVLGVICGICQTKVPKSDFLVILVFCISSEHRNLLEDHDSRIP